MRYLLLLLLTAGCGGAPFSADLLADRDAAEASAPDAPDPDGGLPEADGGGGGQDALAEAGDAQVEAAATVVGHPYADGVLGLTTDRHDYAIAVPTSATLLSTAHSVAASPGLSRSVCGHVECVRHSR